MDRIQCEVSNAGIARVADTYRAWRSGDNYADVPGFVCAAEPDVVVGYGDVLTPDR